MTTNNHTIRPGAFSRGISRCPSGMYAFGGGGYFNPGASVEGSAYNNVANAPSADGTAWTFSGVAPYGIGDDTLVTVTQCAPKAGRDFLVQAGTPVQSANSSISSYADCPAGYTAMAGGFYISNPDGSEATPGNVEWSVPAAHAPGISSWYVNGFAPVNTKMVALAQCIR